MATLFRCYGLHLSANRIIPGLIAAHTDARADLHVQFGRLPHGLASNGASVTRDIADAESDWYGRPQAIAWANCTEAAFFLRYEDGTTFVVDPRACRIWATWPPALSFEDTVVYFLGPVLALVLRLRGTLCLHASAVATDGQAVAFIGPSGAGKSTAAAAFGGRGFPVLTDDLLALHEHDAGVVVHPGYARLRLWPESADLLDDPPGALPALTPNWDKRYLDLQQDCYTFQRHSLPLAAIYVLEARRDDADPPLVESLSAAESLLNLLANVRGDVHLDKQAHRRAFRLLGGLARHLPVRRVIGRAGRNALPRFCEAILDDIESLSGHPAHSGARLCTI